MRAAIGHLIVSVKPISGKMSWTSHDTATNAERQAASSIEARRRGRHTRALYRVNVYETLTGLCSPMGRVVDGR